MYKRAVFHVFSLSVSYAFTSSLSINHSLLYKKVPSPCPLLNLTYKRYTSIRYLKNDQLTNDSNNGMKKQFVLNQSSDNEQRYNETDSKEYNLLPQYVTLGLLLLIFSSNQWCRQAIYYLCNFSENANPFLHMNLDLNFNSENYALLASFGFTTVFALFSLIAGNISDTYNRKNIIVIACLVWSLVTFLQSQTIAFWQLIPLRLILGISQSFFNPAAYTLISDIFPKNLVGRMNGILSGGVYIGGGLASLSILLDDSVGWRNTVSIIGLIGTLLAMLGAVLITEPKSSSPSTKTPALASAESLSEPYEWSVWYESLSKSLSEVLSNREAVLLLVATGIRFCAGFTIGLFLSRIIKLNCLRVVGTICSIFTTIWLTLTFVTLIGIWKAPFVFAKFPEEIALFAGSNAAIVSIGGFLSSYAGGYLSDKISTSSSTAMISNSSLVSNTPPVISLQARAWVPAIGSLLAAPLFALFITSATPVEASFWLLLEYLVAECWIGPTLAALFESVGKSKRGLAQGLFSLLIAFGNTAPVLVSYLTQLKPLSFSAFNVGFAINSFDLSNVLLVTVCGTYIVSGLLFGLAAFVKETSSDIKLN